MIVEAIWRKRIAATAALVSTILASASCGSNGSTGAQSGLDVEQGGPVLLPNPTAYAVSFSQDHTFTDGFDRVLLAGRQTANLDRVELIGGDDYFEVDGVLVAGDKRNIGSNQFDGEFPPVRHRRQLGTLVESEGARLPTGELGSLLLIGMTVNEPGIGYRAGVRIYYTVGGSHYYQDHASAVVNCPGTTKTAECKAVTQQAFDEAQDIASQG